MSGGDLSPQCRAGRHASCMRDADDCLCECHDPVERGSPAAPKIGDTLKPAEARAALSEMEPPPHGMGVIAPRAPDLVDVPCPIAWCTHEPFASEQAVRVHFSRMHRGLTWRGLDPSLYPPVQSVVTRSVVDDLLDESEPEEPVIEHADVPGPAEGLERELREIVERREREEPPETLDEARATRDRAERDRNRRVVSLRCGGEVVLSMTVELFDLRAEDREFVFGLIDAIRNYEETF